MFDVLGVDQPRLKLLRTDERACASLSELSKFDFDLTRHVPLFQCTALLMKALREILDTPLLDADGHVSDASSDLTERYAA